MRALVEHKADIERQSQHFGFTPLMYSVMVDNAKEEPQQVRLPAPSCVFAPTCGYASECIRPVH